jgi:hypothetical protein
MNQHGHPIDLEVVLRFVDIAADALAEAAAAEQAILDNFYSR